jgi:hypothetical protein
VIHHIDEFDPNNVIAVIYMRVSTSDQEKSGNLRNRCDLLRRELQKLGIRVVACYQEVADSRFVLGRPELAEAVAHARSLIQKNLKTTVVVVTDVRNRFIRCEDFRSNPSGDGPSAAQLNELRKLANGVNLATFLHPDMPFGDVKSYETNVPTKLGELSGKKVGRPNKSLSDRESNPPGWKKARRLNLQPAVRILARQGIETRKIASHLGIAESTARSWLL